MISGDSSIGLPQRAGCSYFIMSLFLWYMTIQILFEEDNM